MGGRRGRELEEVAAVAVRVGRQAEVAMDLEQTLQEKPVAGVEGGIVVAAEQPEGRQAHDGVRLFRQDLVRDAVDPTFCVREGDENVGEDRRRAPFPEQPRGAQDVACGLLSAARRNS